MKHNSMHIYIIIWHIGLTDLKLVSLSDDLIETCIFVLVACIIILP